MLCLDSFLKNFCTIYGRVDGRTLTACKNFSPNFQRGKYDFFLSVQTNKPENAIKKAYIPYVKVPLNLSIRPLDYIGNTSAYFVAESRIKRFHEENKNIHFTHIKDSSSTRFFYKSILYQNIEAQSGQKLSIF